MSLADIYSKGVITENCILSIKEVGKNLKEIIELKMKNKLEGKCGRDGYCKTNSVQIITYSSGKLRDGSYVEFEVVIEALFAFPVEGMLINAVANNVTKAGIKASVKNADPSPIIIFISRDHFHTNDYFQSIKENDDITVRVIGQRFELNDPFISVIGELVKPKPDYKAVPKGADPSKPFVVLE